MQDSRYLTLKENQVHVYMARLVRPTIQTTIKGLGYKIRQLKDRRIWVRYKDKVYVFGHQHCIISSEFSDSMLN